MSHIYSAFLYSTITDVSIMQSATLDHDVMMETEGLEDLHNVFEEMDSEATVFMIRTRTPYHAGGVVFKFKARMITSMRQVREMMTTSMISEGEDIAMKIAAVYKETALPGPHEDLRSSAMLHHECRHMAAHLRNTDKEPTIMKEGPETAELRLMTSSASEDQTPAGDVSSHNVQQVHRDDER